jgi:hypothetical protein
LREQNCTWVLALKLRSLFVCADTDVLRKQNRKWRMQEHVSFPVDPTTGKADLLSKP